MMARNLSLTKSLRAIERAFADIDAAVDELPAPCASHVSELDGHGVRSRRPSTIATESEMDPREVTW
jgi:hypothetical protein